MTENTGIPELDTTSDACPAEDALPATAETPSKNQQQELIRAKLYELPAIRLFRPLAIGIHEEAITVLSEFDAALVRRVLGSHCKRPRYIVALARGGARYALNGEKSGEVTATEQEIARKECETRNYTIPEKTDNRPKRKPAPKRVAKPSKPEKPAASQDKLQALAARFSN